MAGSVPLQVSAGLLLGALLLVVLRALAAALEASLVAVGLPRARALAEASDVQHGAKALVRLLVNPEATAFALRAAATGSTLLAGFAAGAGCALLVPARPVLAGLAAALGTAFLSLPLAALARNQGASQGEALALALSPGFLLLSRSLKPVRAIVRALAGGRGRFTLPGPPLEEMERALSEWAKKQGGTESTTELIHNVFEFREKVARDVMVPRTAVVAVEIDQPIQDVLRLLSEEGHSRMPVYRENLDQVLGVLHARDLVPMLQHPELIVLGDLLRPPYFVPWSKPVDQLLREMQKRKLHMAFVVDEHGGIMGICTLEDVLEQIVGALGDEFTGSDDKAVEVHADGTFTVKGQTPIREFNEIAHADLPEDSGVETVGGFLNQLAGAIPMKGDRMHFRGWAFTVSEADPRKVTRVRAARVRPN